MGNGSEFLTVASGAARQAGEVILDGLGRLTRKDIHQKKASDYVTTVDRRSEEVIIEAIRGHFPGHSFLAEESLKEDETEGYRWIIDPLDGTTNFIHGYPMFSVSVALQHQGEIILGVVVDPLRNELYTAEKGRGAYLNGTRLNVSEVTSLEECLITTGFPFRNKDKLDLYLRAFRKIFLSVSAIRRAGSAALDLAHLAAGRCDGFFEFGLAPWDTAAGSILIKEAGGIISDFGGGSEYLSTGNIVAGTRTVHMELLGMIKSVFGGTIDK
jgi:myo-inositol-1(or 4)-monophosphatase